MCQVLRLAVLPAVVALVACAPQTSPQTPPVSPAAEVNAADVAFVHEMLAYHRHAITTVTLAGTRATDPQVKALAAQTAAIQRLQQATMTTLLIGWAQPTTPPMDRRDEDEHVKALSATVGTAFDHTLLTAMIVHNQAAIQAARDALARDLSGQVRGIATSAATGLSAEVDRLQAILDRLPAA